MRVSGSLGHRIASVLAACSLVAALCGSTCEVSACYEDCDPCVSQCRCKTTCNRAVSGSPAAYRLSTYRLSVADDAEGRVVKTWSEISGLSLDLAYGRREHAAADFAGFARGVVEVNGRLLQPRHGTWALAGVEVFESVVLVPFAAADSSLTFAFDRRGNLLEIDEVRPAR